MAPAHTSLSCLMLKSLCSRSAQGFATCTSHQGSTGWSIVLLIGSSPSCKASELPCVPIVDGLMGNVQLGGPTAKHTGKSGPSCALGSETCGGAFEPPDSMYHVMLDHCP